MLYIHKLHPGQKAPPSVQCMGTHTNTYTKYIFDKLTLFFYFNLEINEWYSSKNSLLCEVALRSNPLFITIWNKTARFKSETISPFTYIQPTIHTQNSIYSCRMATQTLFTSMVYSSPKEGSVSIQAFRLWWSTRGQVNQVSWHHLLKHLRTSTSNYYKEV